MRKEILKVFRRDIYMIKDINALLKKADLPELRDTDIIDQVYGRDNRPNGNKGYSGWTLIVSRDLSKAELEKEKRRQQYLKLKNEFEK
jgi:hypothetical protein